MTQHQNYSVNHTDEYQCRRCGALVGFPLDTHTDWHVKLENSLRDPKDIENYLNTLSTAVKERLDAP